VTQKKKAPPTNQKEVKKSDDAQDNPTTDGVKQTDITGDADNELDEKKGLPDKADNTGKGFYGPYKA